MDPTQALIEILEAAFAKDTDALQEYASALIEWIGKGGFAPDEKRIMAWIHAR